jgi:hypothetical protein
LLAALQVEQVALQLQRLRLQQRRLRHASALPASAAAAAAGGSNNRSSSASAAAGAEGALPVAVPVDATHERAHAVPEAACRAAPDPETAAWDAKLVRRYSRRFRDFFFARAELPQRDASYNAHTIENNVVSHWERTGFLSFFLFRQLMRDIRHGTRLVFRGACARSRV